ncbi:hypothetical protein HDU98_009727 [Podochytrium sp. JEL0797]|nr:hypothetical protein HDU98_009727 [Podochytrium sp. JEL0797]
MAKGRYTPLAAAPPAAVDASSSTYSTIQTQPTTSGTLVQADTQATPRQTPAHQQHRHRPSYASHPASPFYCACAPAVASAVAARLGRFFPNRTKAVGYVSGFLFAMAWWLFIDGLVFASTHNSDEMPAAKFEDWVPGILSTLSLIIVNLIDKDSLGADDFSYSGDNVACKARACAFIGITMAMGALGGSFAILALKYLIPGLGGEDIYLGVMIALQNILIFVGSMTLWFGRNSGQDGYGESYGF